MPRICHIFDESTGWEQRIAVNQLLNRLPSDRFSHDLVAIDPVAVRVLSGSGDDQADSGAGGLQVKRRGLAHYPITLCARRLGLSISASITMRAFFEDAVPDLVHAWGAHAAVAARAAADVPMVVSLFDPVLAVRHVKALRTLAQGDGAASGPFPDGRGSDGGQLADKRGAVGVACSCEIVRRRLVEGGLDEGQAVVIRPGVEFGRINAARRSGLRKRLGIARDDKVVLVPFEREPGYGFPFPFSREVGSHNTGCLDAAWAVTLLNHVYGGYRIILPGATTQSWDISRFLAGLPTASPVVYVRENHGESDVDGYLYEDLLAISDVLVVPVRGDVSTTAIAWAMASNTAVIGSAVYAVAELLANKVNGLLFKPPPRDGSMAVAIARLLRDDASLVKVRETVRGQAYEVFGQRRFVDDYRRLYVNLLGGQAVYEGIGDSARVG